MAVFSAREYFVAIDCQRLPLVSCLELDPGDFLGVASVLFLRVSLDIFRGPPSLYWLSFFGPFFIVYSNRPQGLVFFVSLFDGAFSPLFITVYSIHDNIYIAGDVPPMLLNPLSLLPLPVAAGLPDRLNTNKCAAVERVG